MISVSIMSSTKYSSSVSCGMANSSEPALPAAYKFLSPGHGPFAQSLGASHVPVERGFLIPSELLHQQVEGFSTDRSAIDFFKVAVFSFYLSHRREKRETFERPGTRNHKATWHGLCV
jgi:hypothetical protein